MSYKNSKNLHDLEAECLDHMTSNDLSLHDRLICDGCIHRYSSDGGRDRDEWYRASHITTARGYSYLRCAYGSWSKGIAYSYNSFIENKFYDSEEKREFYEKLKRDREQERIRWQEFRDRAAQVAARLYNDASAVPLDSSYDEYLRLKGIKPFGSVRYGLNSMGHQSLIIPLYNIAGEIRSLQFVSVDRASKKIYKSFLPGGEKGGSFFLSGIPKPGDVIYIAEGYATAASVFEATGCVSVVAFDAGNLLPVTENIKNKFPNCSIVIAGDDDADKTPNVGKEKALAAAARVGCSVVFPVFPDDKCRDGDGKRYTDFNDLHQVCSLKTTGKQLMKFETPESEAGVILKKLDKLLLYEDPCSCFDASLLPPRLGKFIIETSKTTSAHPIMIAAAAICSVSACLGKKVFIPEGKTRDKFYQRLYPNLWIVSVADSGQYKTTALNKGAKVAMRRAYDCFQRIKELQREQNEIFGKGFEALKARAEIQEKIIAESLNNPVLTDRTTSEALFDALSEGRTGVILCGEFSTWLGEMDKSYNEGLKKLFTELYDVPMIKERVTKTKQSFIEYPCFSICGASTLMWMKDDLKKDVKSGFFARFLLFAPPATEDNSTFLPSQTQDCDYEQCVDDFSIAIDLIGLSIGNERRFRISPEAAFLGDQIYAVLKKLPDRYDDSLKAILSAYVKRWSPYLLKVAMIMQLFIDAESEEISFEAIQAAAPFIASAVKSTIQLFEGELGASEFQNKCQKILDYLYRKTKDLKGKSISYAQISSSRILDGGNKEYDEVFAFLVDSGKIEETRSSSGKKKETVFKPIFPEVE